MKKHLYRYDLHIHTCLSPCGDEDMTPNNIANMSALKNLDIIAVSDHNTVKNCRAVIKAAKQNGLPLLVIPAVEITTSEDIHVLVFFPDINTAEKFEQEIIDAKRNPVKNKTEIFGEQTIMDENDEKTGEYENLLINSINLSVDDIKKTADAYNSIAIPAHIDKEENGIISILGSFPAYIGFEAAEIKNKEKNDDIINKENLHGKKIINNSDAHYLWDIKEYGGSEKEEDFIVSDMEITNAEIFIRYMLNR